MAVETVLLALLGVVAAWLVVDAGRERHRLRARMERAASRGRRPHGASTRFGPADDRTVAGARSSASADDGWRYWPLTVSTSEDGSIGPRL